MKTYLDCIPCFMQQALNTGRAAGMEDVQIKALLDTIGAKIKHFKMQNNPPEMANIIYKEIRKNNWANRSVQRPKTAAYP